MPTDETPPDSARGNPRDLHAAAREVEEFVAASGWSQPTQLFALVATSFLLAEQPELAGTVDAGSTFTPVAQEELPSQDLAEALGSIEWPPTVSGCALAQEIVILPPGAEEQLDATVADSDQMRAVAAAHPDRREARLVAAVLRDGSQSCVLRLREQEEAGEQRVEHPELAPNLTSALLATFS